MSKFNNIGQVSVTLKTFLANNIPEISGTSDIVFDSPATLTAATNPVLSIFLYRVSHNAEMRNMPSYRTGISTATPAPLPLQLEYVFTPFASNIETEFSILERIAGLFYDNSVLSGSQLTGDLVANGNTELRIVPNDLSVDEINKLWQAFQNNPYHLGIAYMVSPVYVPSTKTEEFKRVVRRDVEYVARYMDLEDNQ